MKIIQIITICLLTSFCACCEITDIENSNPSLQSTYHSRSAENTSLPNGATALFNISGVLEIHNQTFTYNGHCWENKEKFEWNGEEGNIYLTAIYPAMENYSNHNLYTNNKLNDILLAQDTLPANNDIKLHFKHLFSSLTIHINENIQEELQEIQLTVPNTVSSLNPSNGEYITENESCTSSATYNNTGIYQFILPPMEKATLRLQLVLLDGTSYSHEMQPYTFQSGCRYECTITKESQRPGIRNVEDLIAFSLLINKQNYTGNKTLMDFGEEIEGTTVYRLLNDLTLTEEESKKLLPIGYYDARVFQDVFDGEGHCISNLTIPDKSTYSKVNVTYSGLFGHIGTNGIVKNLHLKHARSTTNPTCTRIGVIAALNEGKILDCSVKHSVITNGINEKTGFIAGQLSTSGYIINSFASNDTLTASQSNYVGGICGYANGNILNCYTANNYYKLSSSGSGGGGIAGYSSSSYLLNIANCYTYHQKSGDKYWAIMESAKKVNVENFFYNEGTLYNAQNSSGITQKNVLKYDDQFKANGISIIDWLNDWVEIQGNNGYSDFIFKKWVSQDGEITFE